MIPTMSDDFGTINVSRAERAREIEGIRQQYRRHRESLESMIADAPPEPLTTGYRRLVSEIDAALGKLDELSRESPPGSPPPPDLDPGLRPLVTTYLPESELEPRSRLPLILGIAFVALAAIGWLIWRASSNRKTSPLVEDTTATSATASTETTATQAPAAAALTVAPPSQDYGVIRKGTRATRQFEVTNHTDAPITISLPRSTCRCLYYEYQARIDPKGKESVTVTIDGARAPVGNLRETIRVSAKSDPAVGTSFDVIATIQ
jgi:uncharacterized protein DUF1573